MMVSLTSRHHSINRSLLTASFSFANTAKYKSGWLRDVGAPDLPEENPDDNVEAGDDEGEYRPTDPSELPQVSGEEFASAEEDFIQENPNEPLDETIQDNIDELVAEVSNIDMSSNTIVTKPFYAQGVKVKGFDRDAVTNALGVCCFLGPGAVLSSLDIELMSDLQTYKVKGHTAVELGKASHLLPAETIFRLNPTIFESLKQSVQVVLNENETDDQDNPILKGSGKLAKRQPEKCSLSTSCISPSQSRMLRRIKDKRMTSG